MSGRGKAQKSIDLIDAALRILDEIQPASVRAVCYRLFVAGIIPSMAKANTNAVSRQLVYAREEGIIPWEHIVDETRAAETICTWSSPREIFESAARAYRYDFWSEQPERVEVWSEKGTVRGTLRPVLDAYAVTLRVMHGHASATAVNDAAAVSRRSAKPMTVLYVGDYDPSGMHMSEIDLPERIERYGGEIEIVRVAIAAEYVGARGVPSFDVADKRSDPRHGWFVENYGKRCIELDALSPNILRDRVKDEIVARLDLDAWAHAEKIEAVQRDAITQYVASLHSISMPAAKYSDEAL